jgi:uncharacterized protein YbaR (Trm112 family)
MASCYTELIASHFMKRVRCPKCDHFIQFDETKYSEGQSLVFVCDNCQKQFGIRIGVSKLRALQKEENKGTAVHQDEEQENWGTIVAVENVFGFRQEHPLQLGDNIIGRRNKGDEVQIPIETTDPSMDRRHCILNVKRNKQGKLTYTLRDNESITGTFLMNEILGAKDRIRIEDGAIITLGATTLILHTVE